MPLIDVATILQEIEIRISQLSDDNGTFLQSDRKMELEHLKDWIEANMRVYGTS